MYWKASEDINKTKKFVDFELGNIENEKWNRWLITLKETKQLIGTCLLYFNEEEDSWDISYNLGRALLRNIVKMRLNSYFCYKRFAFMIGIAVLLEEKIAWEIT